MKKEDSFRYDVADIPEAGDMVSVERRTKSTFPCHNCVTARHGFGGSRTGEWRTVVAFQKLLLDQKLDPWMKQKRLLTFKCLQSHQCYIAFPLSEFTAPFGFYAIFQLELMHSLSLCLSKTFKGCSFKYLSDLQMKIISNSLPIRRTKVIFYIYMTVLKYLNLFCTKQMVPHSEMVWELTFSKENVGVHFLDFVLSLYNWYVVGCRIEGNWWRSSVFGSSFDTCCGNSTSSSETEFCTTYVDLMNRMYGPFRS